VRQGKAQAEQDYQQAQAQAEQQATATDQQKCPPSRRPFLPASKGAGTA